jgi:two-component system nitrate/nitrite response regulator NarL
LIRVLLIDDDPHIRSGLRRLLVMKYRAEVSEATDGEKGCRHLLEHSCDLVLLDLHMRTMDGMDTLRAIRRSPKHSSVPVFMLTGDSDASVVASAMAIGVEGFLIKPVDATVLFERIDAALARVARERPPEDRPDPGVPPSTPKPPAPLKRVLADCVKLR